VNRAVILLAAAMLVLAGAMAQARLIAPEVSDQAISDGLPRTLEEYGFFIDAPGQIPTLGVVPYQLNVPLYSDGAEKLRFVYVPKGTRLSADGEGLLQFPVGSALIKTFAFGEGDERRLIETRVLLHRSEGWVALPYRWNEEQTEARLALAGARLDLTTPSGEAISYRIPNKNQCKECHSLNDKVIPIGPKARNLGASRLDQQVEDGLLSGRPEVTRSFPDWHERGPGADSAGLARAYLDVNCAHCHRPGGMASNSGLDLRWEQDDLRAIGILKRPVAAGRGSGGLEFDIVPGSPESSILYHRMSSREPGVAMPELGQATVDPEGLAVIRAWIEEMP
jgi:uncharacterized repeat protein (TIGR03806 family)